MVFAEATCTMSIQRNKKIFEGSCQDPKLAVNTIYNYSMWLVDAQNQ